MLGAKERRTAAERLKEANRAYDSLVKKVRKESISLFELRKEIKAVIESCEVYISQLANAPRDFEKSITGLRIEYQKFSSQISKFEAESFDDSVKAGLGVTGAAAAGVGVGALGPTAAMAIATTFGTASTGAAISALSGAAATNAALAWLGGGAIAAGGGGMAAGKALLALAGPVGWAIGGAGLAVAATQYRRKNRQAIAEAYELLEKIHKETREFERLQFEVENLTKLTLQHQQGVIDQLERLNRSAPRDYSRFSNSDKALLGALINNVNSLAQLINMQVQIKEHPA